MLGKRMAAAELVYMLIGEHTALSSWEVLVPGTGDPSLDREGGIPMKAPPEHMRLDGCHRKHKTGKAMNELKVPC